MGHARWIGFVMLTGGCTTLGPMPSTTGVAPLPAARPAVEVQAGIAPGHYLSSGVTHDPEGSGIAQLAALFEPDEVIGVPGLIIGGRVFGGDDSGVVTEPMLGYRRAFGERLAAGALIYGSHASGDHQGASYSATRVGVEVAGDVLVTPRSKWAEVHVVLGAAVTGLAADGTYCLDGDRRFGIDCPEGGGGMRVDVTASGLYPSGQAAVALDFGRHLDAAFHGVRLALLGTLATMPTAVGGRQGDAEAYFSAGLLLTVGVGSAASTDR